MEIDRYEELFIDWERTARDSIDVKRIYIDMAEDLVAGIMLSQIIYYHLPTKSGENKMVIKRNGYKWVAKTHSDWLHECRISKKQASTALDHLKELGLIVTDRFKFADKVQTHIRINWDTFRDKHTYCRMNVSCLDDVEKYWNEELLQKDGRSNKKVTLQKGDSTNCSIGSQPTLQNVISESDEKDDSYSTKITPKTTDSKTTILATKIPQEFDILNPAEKSPITKQPFNRRLGLLGILAARESEINTIPETFKVNYGSNDRTRKVNNTFRERMFLLASYLTDMKVAFGGKEAKAIDTLVSSVTADVYSELEVYGCAIWAMEKRMFEDEGTRIGYSRSIVSINKLLPSFVRQLREGKLDFNPVKQFETTAQASARIYEERERNSEQISQSAAQYAEEYRQRTGVTKPARI